MLRKFFPSPAMAVALVALGIALGGSAVAGTGLITGTQIKDHSIGLNDLSYTAIARLHGQQGPQGLPGPPGPIGPAGAAGATANIFALQTAEQNDARKISDICGFGGRVVSGVTISSLSNTLFVTYNNCF
jgi:hypothetical protein